MREKNTEQESAATENQPPFDSFINAEKMKEMMGAGGCGCGGMMKEMMTHCGGMMKEMMGGAPSDTPEPASSEKDTEKGTEKESDEKTSS